MGALLHLSPSWDAILLIIGFQSPKRGKQHIHRLLTALFKEIHITCADVPLTAVSAGHALTIKERLGRIVGAGRRHDTIIEHIALSSSPTQVDSQIQYEL